MKKDKPWKRLPKVPVIQENLDAFYRFIYDRHTIWHRRFVEKKPPPWTHDPILRDYKFTNVYRELDRGTVWLMKNVVDPTLNSRESESDIQMDLLWTITLYRLLNKVETFEKIGVPNFWDWKPGFRGSWKRCLKRLHKTDSVFTSAHLTLPTHTIGKTKIGTYIEVLNAFHKNLHKISWDIGEAESLEEVWKILQRIPCVGPFIAYEIAVDLIHAKIIKFSEDSWVNAGPGCRMGLRLIFPLTKKPAEFQRAIFRLKEEQDYHFNRIGLMFPYYKGKFLTLRNIEHSLCEYGKYWKMKHKCGKHRQRFKPTSTADLYR